MEGGTNPFDALLSATLGMVNLPTEAGLVEPMPKVLTMRGAPAPGGGTMGPGSPILGDGTMQGLGGMAK